MTGRDGPPLSLSTGTLGGLGIFCGDLLKEEGRLSKYDKSSMKVLTTDSIERDRFLGSLTRTALATGLPLVRLEEEAASFGAEEIDSVAGAVE